MRTFLSVKGFRRWSRMGLAGRIKQLIKDDLGKQRWFHPSRQKRWVPGKEEI
jgi:hypothetical protein